MVRITGLEPACLSAQEPKSCVSASFTISAYELLSKPNSPLTDTYYSCARIPAKGFFIIRLDLKLAPLGAIDKT